MSALNMVPVPSRLALWLEVMRFYMFPKTHTDQATGQVTTQKVTYMCKRNTYACFAQETLL
jgi:hypothetical protein